MVPRPVIVALLVTAVASPARADTGAEWTAPLDLEHAAFAQAEIPDTVVHVPPTFDARPPVHVVVALHGWSCCAASFVGTTPCGPSDPARSGWGLARIHDRARTNTILVVPQLALLRRDSSPGRFGERGFFRAWLAEVLASRPFSEHLGRSIPVSAVGSVTLVAHSAGFQTALAILEQGDVEIRNVVLLDALYSGTERFAAWLASGSPDAGRHLVSVHTSLRSTKRQSALLARLVRARLGRAAVMRARPDALSAAIRSYPLVVAETPYVHGEVPARHLTEILSGLYGTTQPGAD